MIDYKTTVTDLNAQLEASQVELAALRQKILEAEILQAANLALTQSLDLDAILETFLDLLYQVIPFDSATIMLLEDGARLVARAVRGYEKWCDPALARAVSFNFTTTPSVNEVVSQQTSFIIPDTRQYPYWVKVPSSEHVCNWLAVPLVVNGRTIGIYSLDKAEPSFFTETHRHLAEALAIQAAMAIQNARFYESELAARQKAETQANQLDALNRMAQAVTSVLDLKTILDIAAAEIVELLDARSCGVALLNPDRTLLEVVAYATLGNEPSAVGLVIPLAENIATQQVIENRQTIVLADAQNTPLQNDATREIMRTRNTQCILLMPLLMRGEVIGTIGPDTDQVGRVFTQEEVRLAETIGSQIAGAIDNARLFREAREASEAAELARAAAEAANESKSAFLANVSHELRTPLTSILGFTRIVQKRLEERIFPQLQAGDPKTQRAATQVEENLGIILTEGQRLTTLINNVLDLEKIEAGKMDWSLEPLALAEVIAQATAATASLFEQKGLSLVEELPAGLPQVSGDRDKLVQVVINLISNAVKFTDQGMVRVRAQVADGEIRVSVTDQGIGIAEADQPLVFEKFKQVGDTLTDKPKGTGLGLPICKEIVEHHGGRIWVESALGQGSTFAFTLPIDNLRRTDD